MAGVLYAAAGGACGAAARYIISCIPLKTAFPLLTLITNVLEDRSVRRIHDVFGFLAGGCGTF